MTAGVSTRKGGTGLTRAQELLWAAEQMYPSTPMYNQAFMFVIGTDIDERRFAECFRTVIDECDSLRTVVRQSGESVEQVVLSHIPFHLPVLDFTLEPSPRDAFRQWSMEATKRPLDTTSRTFESALAKLGDGRTGWYLSQHHMVTDALSFSLLFRRMEALYIGGSDEESPSSRALPPFADYISHEAGTQPDRSETPMVTEQPSPLYGAAPDDPGTENDRTSIALGEPRSESIRALAQRPGIRALTHDLSMFRVFLTALTAFLYRVTGEESVRIGAPAHNRVTEAFRRTVGLFTEINGLSVEISNSDTFESLFAKVVSATDHFLRVSRPGAGSAAVNRSVNTVLNYITADFESFDGAEVEATWVHSGHVEPEHHLRLHVTDFDRDGDIELLFDCNRKVLGGRALHVADHFLGMLDALLDDFDRPIADIDLLTDEERASIGTFNDTSTTAATPTVVDLIEAQMARSPDRSALVTGEETWTFRDLDRLTRGIASRLPQRSVIGICMSRSAEAAIAMLGVMRAGSAYVPIDPGWPDQRIRLVVEDADCCLVITGTELDLGVPTIDYRTVSSASVGYTESKTDPGDLAYILYTSGSTGRPKGVAIEHRSLANYVEWASDFYDRGSRLSFPLFTPLTFDLTVTSIFVPLASGGTVVVYPDSGQHGVDLALKQVLEDDLVDIVKLTPSHLAVLGDMDLSESRISQLILGGEQLHTSTVRKISKLFGVIEVHNEYGPTEGTVGCIVHTFDPTNDTNPTVPIGRPIANARAYVLGPGGLPNPIGVPGELWIGGAGIARGYVNDTAGTEERFIPNPALGESVLYRTGDRARLRADGVMEYLGRRDDQIKLRGVRLELGEIEAAVTSHREVTSSAAKIHPRTSPQDPTSLVHCSRCGLPSNFPDVSFDSSGLCNHCRAYESYADRADAYFKPMSELEELFDSIRGADDREYDCIALLSGGKDSTYALCKLVDMGVRVLAFTLDNGYISDQAKANIKRVCNVLGVDHVFGSTPAMDEIFVDSLQRHSNVCNGCFKTIYTLSTQVAHDRGIPVIVTGLSRGQFFETRLTGDLFTDEAASAEEIDAKVLEARKAYHRTEDAPRRLLDVRIFNNEMIFDQVKYVDFYRYCYVGLEDMLEYLNTRVPWIRPSDTGRSTNCLINDVGIFVHRHEKGFHNYALPYSWDVRLGAKTREEAMDELDDDIDVAEVQRILEEIGYPEDVNGIGSDSRLVAYYTGPTSLTEPEVREHVARILPSQLMPNRFVHLETIPLTDNGKIDRAALPNPTSARPEVNVPFIEARTATERRLAGVWSDVLGLDTVGVRDNFFDLGGDSIKAIQIVARSRRQGLDVSLRQLFESLTLEHLAESATQAPSKALEEHVREERNPAEFPNSGLDDAGLNRLAEILQDTDGKRRS